MASQNGKLLRFGSQHRTMTSIADIGKYSLTNPLPGHEPDTDPYGVLASGADRFVVDAANNTLLNVLDGQIQRVATFEPPVAAPIDGVPTSIAEHNGHLYIGQLSSLEPGKAKVTVFTQGRKAPAGHQWPDLGHRRGGRSQRRHLRDRDLHRPTVQLAGRAGQDPGQRWTPRHHADAGARRGGRRSARAASTCRSTASTSKTGAVVRMTN